MELIVAGQLTDLGKVTGRGSTGSCWHRLGHRVNTLHLVVDSTSCDDQPWFWCLVQTEPHLGSSHLGHRGSREHLYYVPSASWGLYKHHWISVLLHLDTVDLGCSLAGSYIVAYGAASFVSTHQIPVACFTNHDNSKCLQTLPNVWGAGDKNLTWSKTTAWFYPYST